jgi:hypothetical protein
MTPRSARSQRHRDELQLELRGVDPLGLCDHRASARQLDLERQLPVRLAQAIPLGDGLVGLRLLCRTRGALGGQRLLGLGDARSNASGVAG